MVQVFKENRQFILILLFWLITGMYAGPLIFGIVPLFIFIMFKKGFYSELIIGFWFIIILSDSYENSLEFAKNLKSVYILLLALIFFVNQNLFYPINRFYWIFLPYFISSLISIILFSPILSTSLQKYLSYLLLFIIMPNYVYLCYKKDGVDFFKKMVYFFGVILFIGLVYFFTDPNFATSHGGRMKGIFGNPNGLALFCFITFIFFVIVNNIRPNLFNQKEKIIFYGLILSSSILSGSRNVFVATAIFLVSISVFKKSFLLGISFSIIAYMAFEIIGNNYVAIIKALGLEEFFRLETLDEGGGRYVAWNFAWINIQDYFFMGRGFAWDEKLMGSNFRYLSALGHEGGVHNSYLILWLNSGLIGLVLFLIALFSKIYLAYNKNKIAIAMLLACMMTISFEPWIVASLNPYTLIFITNIVILNDYHFYEKSQQLIENNINLKSTV